MDVHFPILTPIKFSKCQDLPFANLFPCIGSMTMGPTASPMGASFPLRERNLGCNSRAIRRWQQTIEVLYAALLPSCGSSGFCSPDTASFSCRTPTSPTPPPDPLTSPTGAGWAQARPLPFSPAWTPGQQLRRMPRPKRKINGGRQCACSQTPRRAPPSPMEQLLCTSGYRLA